MLRYHLILRGNKQFSVFVFAFRQEVRQRVVGRCCGNVVVTVAASQLTTT